MTQPFEEILTGGHPNSLGRTEEVVALVVADPGRFDELYRCYQSDDDVVRLRVSSAMKRLEIARHDLLIPYIGRLISEIGTLDQASAQWTLAILFDKLKPDMSPTQAEQALDLLKRNLAKHDDWIVLNTTIDVLTRWAKADISLACWITPHLKRLTNDQRKSVSKRAAKALNTLS